VKAAPDEQLRLLDLAALDIRVTQLDHKAKTLPERAQLAEIATKLPIASDAVALLSAQLGDLEREIARIEGEIEQVRARVAKDQAILDGGTGTAQVLESLQHELQTLARRQGELEEAELEVLEQAETITGQRNAAQSIESDLLAERDRIDVALQAALSDIGVEKSGVVEERAAVASSVSAELLGLYEKVRADVGTGAALLQRRQCQGCHVELTASEIDRLRSAPADDVQRCEECRRILVRTPESGL
jgi:uncharacterized protein